MFDVRRRVAFLLGLLSAAVAVQPDLHAQELLGASSLSHQEAGELEHPGDALELPTTAGLLRRESREASGQHRYATPVADAPEEKAMFGAASAPSASAHAHSAAPAVAEPAAALVQATKAAPAAASAAAAATPAPTADAGLAEQKAREEALAKLKDPEDPSKGTVEEIKRMRTKYLSTPLNVLFDTTPLLEPVEFFYDGRFKMVDPVTDRSTITLMTEEGTACRQNAPDFICTGQLGSYGVNKLHTYSYYSVEKWGWKMPKWMESAEVQGKRLLDVVFPMSHAAGSYEMFGNQQVDDGKGPSVNVLKQSLDVYQQLNMGVRALEIGVAYNTVLKRLYTAENDLTAPLGRVLLDILLFLSENEGEVVILDFRKAKLSPTSKHGSLVPLIKDETDPDRIPGQRVHKQVNRILGEHLATSKKLTSSADASATIGDIANPLISALVALKSRVIYFWEGQQVLCFTKLDCRFTPGWSAPVYGSRSQPLAFGKGIKLGDRSFVGAGGVARKGTEPLCMNPSSRYGKDSRGSVLIEHLSEFSRKTRNITEGNPPSCYPKGLEAVPVHEAPLFHRLDAYVTFTAEEEAKRMAYLRDKKFKFTRGEPITHRSDAERVNYLVLTWYLNRDNSDIVKRMNAISMDFVHPTLIKRIVSLMQEAPDCGLAIYCMDSGSCLTADLASPKGGSTCVDQVTMEKDLWDHAEDRYFSWTARFYMIGIFWIFVKLNVVRALLKGRFPKGKASEKLPADAPAAAQPAAAAGAGLNVGSS